MEKRIHYLEGLLNTFNMFGGGYKSQEPEVKEVVYDFNDDDDSEEEEEEE